MSAPAAIQGSYADLKTVKSRKVIQIIVEIPTEAGDAFVAAFGMPNPAAEIPVALARLQSGPEQAKERRKFEDLPLAQQAGIRCSDPVFQQFAVEMLEAPGKSELWAAESVRKWCGVLTRAELEKSESSTNAWRRIEDKFVAWRNVA
jgi:hypothetical protein